MLDWVERQSHSHPIYYDRANLFPLSSHPTFSRYAAFFPIFFLVFGTFVFFLSDGANMFWRDKSSSDGPVCLIGSANNQP